MNRQALAVILFAAVAAGSVVSAVDYDPKLSTYLADLSELAYQNPFPPVPWLSQVTVHDDQGSANSRAVVALDTQRKYILVFFRGSVTQDIDGNTDLQNWMDNFNVAHEEWPSWLVDPMWYNWDFWGFYNSYKAHDGFVNHWGSMYYEVKANLEALLPGRDDYQIIFTGHSLGGVAAQLGALDLHHMMHWGTRKPIVYTYGSLRVFNHMLAKYYDGILGDTTFRVTYKRDIAPAFPLCGGMDFWEPCTWNDGSENSDATYFHAGKTVHYEEFSDSYTICDYGEDPACHYRYWADSLTTMSVPDHLAYTDDIVYDDQCLVVRFSSVNYGNFIQENNGALLHEATATDLGKWRIIPGLANPDCYTFESTTSPGTYMYHDSDSVARMGGNDKYEEATFCVTEALKTGYSPAASGEKIVSLEAHSAQGKFLRHANNIMYAHASDGSELFKNDATWRMTCA
jgi:hypothetical protein